MLSLLEVGAALAQPPKSSSAATVGAGLLAADVAGVPQPAPMSFAVNVSGTFIALEIVEVVVDGAGAGSGVLHALLPHGSMLADESMLVTADVDVVAAAFGADLDVSENDEDERLNTEFTFVADGGDVGLEGGDGVVVMVVVVVVVVDVRSNRSLAADDLGGFGFDADAVVV